LLQLNGIAQDQREFRVRLACDFLNFHQNMPRLIKHHSL
jgi:hypothetical protein